MKVIFYVYITIIQQDAAVRSQFYFIGALLYMFRLVSTPIIRSTLTVSTATGTGHTSVQLPSSNVTEFQLLTRPRWRRVAAPMYDLYRRLWIQLKYSWWWVWKASETCRVTLQWNKMWLRTAASCWIIKIQFYGISLSFRGLGDCYRLPWFIYGLALTVLPACFITPYHCIGFPQFFLYVLLLIYRIIHKSLWDFRTRLRNNQDRHGRKEHINR